MQTDSIRDVFAAAWVGVRRFAVLAAALLLAVSLIVTATGSDETASGGTDDVHTASAKWRQSDEPRDLPEPISRLLSRGPSWT